MNRAELMRRSLRQVRGFLLRAVGSAVVRQVAFLSLPWLLGRALDDGIRTGSVRATAGWALLLALAAAVEYAGMRGWVWYANLAGARAGIWLRAELLRSLLSAETADRGHGDLAARAGRDVQAVLAWVHGLPTWVVIGTTAVVLVPGIARLDPMLLLVAVLTVPVVVLANRLFPRLVDRRAAELAEAHGRRTGTAEELLTSMLPLRGVGADSLLVDRHHRHSAGITEAALRLARVTASWETTGWLVPQTAVVAGLLAGGLAALDGGLTVGALTTFVLWMGTVSMAVNVTVIRLGERAEALASAARIAELLEPSPFWPGPDVLPERGLLEVTGLTVERDGRPLIGPLDLVAAPGEWVVLTGATGSGKSTLLRAMARLQPLSGGAVRFGGVDLAGVAPETLYETLGFVPENPLLLSGTIGENLRLAADADPAAALRTAGLDLDPDTPVGDHGGALSGGQRQRVALARALLREPRVLLLDDVTSALDARTEAVVLDRLRAATRETVVVFAGHSGAVRDRADRVIELVGGAVPVRG
ncbi:ABC transporter ATP-binding protein [Actinoplanes sp. NPDC024001]|uniref:ABC transporter ATP-binding protein n=1 Tax=Actinoplanes sp. NPDC024001 TaxID=3154598 RepID=UPI0033ED0E4D